MNDPARPPAGSPPEVLATALEQAAEAVLVTDADGVITWVNPAFERTTGYSRAEAIGRKPSLLKSGAQPPDVYRQLWATIRAGAVWRGRLVNRRKDGTLYTEEASIAPVRDASGAIRSFVAVKRDVTQELDLEQRFTQAQKMESVGRLAAGVAHDFNNVLSAIVGYAHLAVANAGDCRELQADLGEIKAAADRASALTRQLLVFSRRQMLRPEAIDLGEVAARLERMLRRLIPEDVELRLLRKPGLGLVLADPGQIEQVIVNLAVNARDAMPRGGVLTIRVEEEWLDAVQAGRCHAQPGPHVVLSVADTGVGMDEQTRARVFEPYFTTKPPGKGSGLGLATVYGIVEQTGGVVTFQSAPGCGTCFRVCLPVLDEARDAQARHRVEELPVRGRGHETILVIEDEQQVAAVAQRLLESFGYRVFTAASAEDARALFRAHKNTIALVLTDVVLPGEDGVACAAELRMRRPDLPVLYMSGYSEDALASRLLAADHDLVLKPFGPELADRVRCAIDAARASQSAAAHG